MSVQEGYTTDTLAQANGDPTRTQTLRRRYAQRLRGRFANINTKIRSGVRDRDVFGLKDERRTRSETLEVSPLPSQFPARRDRQIETFDRWLQRQLDNEVLTAIGPNQNQFIRTAYLRGLGHAETAARQAGIDVPPGSSVEATVRRPLHREELELIYTRDYSELEGITQAVSQQANRTLAEGLRSGEGPADIARRLTDRIDNIGKTRATVLARTSIIDTFNSASLARYGELGVEGVSADVEHVTAGDRRVCPVCRSLEGNVYTLEEAQGRIPVHPQCRCSWLPVGPSS